MSRCVSLRSAYKNNSVDALNNLYSLLDQDIEPSHHRTTEMYRPTAKPPTLRCTLGINYS